MRNRDHSTVSELLLDQLLYLFLCHHINIRCRFIEHNHLVLPQYRPANADKLAFTGAKIGPSFTDLEVNTFTFLFAALSCFVCAVLF